MHRILASLLVFLVAGLFVAPSAVAQHQQIQRIRGEITAVDAAAGTFELTTPGGHAVTVRTGAKTRFQIDGQAGSIDDLEVGMRAVVAGLPDPKTKTFRARIVRAKSAP